MRGITLDSLVWGVRSIKSCGGGIRGMYIHDYESEQFAANHFKDAPLTGLSSLTCIGTSDIVDKIPHAIPVMTRLEGLHILGVSDSFRLSNLLLQLVSSNVKMLSLPHLTNEDSLKYCCSALQQLIESSSSGKLVELKLCISHITASKLLNIILAPSSLQTVTLNLDDKVPFLDLPATCTNNNVAELACTGVPIGLIPAQVVDLMERNRALQELIMDSCQMCDHHSFLLYSYEVIKGIPESSSLERIVIHNYGKYASLNIECREEGDDLRECAKQSADSFIKLVTERSFIKTLNGCIED